MTLTVRQGVGNRAYYRWIKRDGLSLFPHLPACRLFATHRDWAQRLADPTLGIADSYGIELLHPIREGRSEAQIGKKGKSNYRWIVGGVSFVLNQRGQVVAWEVATANVHALPFIPIIRWCSRTRASTATQHDEDLQPRGMCEWWSQAMLTVCATSNTSVTLAFAWTMAAYNVLVSWHGLKDFSL